MKLESAILRPGIVLKCCENGIIKASAPGLFSAEDDTSLLPPIYPFPIGAANTFSSVTEGDEVWILNFKDNPLQLHWLRKDSMNNNKDLLQEENVDIICNRERGTSWATIYFSDGTGWMIRSDGSYINIDKDGNVIITNGQPNRDIVIDDNGVSIGSADHPAVLGDSLIDVLTKLSTILSMLATTAQASPYTTQIGTTLTPLLPDFKASIPGIISQHVKLA